MVISSSASWWCTSCHRRCMSAIIIFASAVMIRLGMLRLSDESFIEHHHEGDINDVDAAYSFSNNGTNGWEVSSEQSGADENEYTYQHYVNSTSEGDEAVLQDLVDAPSNSNEIEGNKNTFSVPASSTQGNNDTSNDALSITSSFITRADNIHSLSHLAWSNRKKQTGSDISVSCMEAAYYKFTKHGCCLSEKQYPLQIADSFDTTALLEKWRDKRIEFIGDSMTQQLIDAILTNAYIDGITNTTQYNPPQHGSDIIQFNNFNTTISKLPTVGGGISQINGQLLPIDFSTGPHSFETSVKHADIAYVSFGLHLVDLSVEQCTAMFQYVRKVLEEDMAKHPHKQHYYRTTFPQHFEGGMKNGEVVGADYRDKTSINCVGYGIDTADHWTSILAKHVFKGSAVIVLDYFDFLRYRGDLHSLYNPGDCSHWCWDYEMWRGVFYLMHNVLLPQQ